MVKTRNYELGAGVIKTNDHFCWKSCEGHAQSDEILLGLSRTWMDVETIGCGMVTGILNL